MYHFRYASERIKNLHLPCLLHLTRHLTVAVSSRLLDDTQWGHRVQLQNLLTKRFFFSQKFAANGWLFIKWLRGQVLLAPTLQSHTEVMPGPGSVSLGEQQWPRLLLPRSSTFKELGRATCCHTVFHATCCH